MIRAWLVDDEELALKRLSRMLAATGRVTVVGMTTDPEELLRQLPGSPADALFLDIEMPGSNGFELLNKLETAPAVIFTTAYDRYAVRAFEVNGTDYLLKPVSPESLDRAIAKLERAHAMAADDYRAMLQRLTEALGTSRIYPRRIASKIGDRVQFVDLDKVTHFFAEGKVTYAATSGRNFIVDDSIVQLEAKLDPNEFVRIHRAYLVNISSVSEVCSWFGGRLIARLNNAAKTELPIARDRVRNLKDRLGF